MKTTNYILTKYETVRKTEKVEYEIEVPEKIKNKTQYADNQILKNNYKNCKTVDIIDSELLDEEIVNLKKRATNSSVKRNF